MAELIRLESTRKMGGLIDAYWEDLRQAHQQGRKIAWTCGAPPYIHLAAQGIPYHHAESFGAYVSGRKEQAPFLEACEAMGYSTEMCSYERLSFGHIGLLRRGASMDRRYSLPPPDFAYTARACPNHAHFVEAISRIYNIPRVIIDIPIHVFSASDYAETVAYVERQFREVFIPFVEQITRRPYNWDKLKEQTRVLKRAIELRSYCIDLCKKSRPAPMTIFDAFMSIAVVVAMAGSPKTIPYYEDLKAEVEQRVAQGIGGITDEKYRLFYDHMPIWYKLGDWSRKLAGYGANIVAATYTHSEVFPRFAEDWDPERPLHSLAEFQLRTNRCALPKYKLDWIIEACKEYSIDGVIFHSHRTCRFFDLDQYETARALERTLGIPSVIIDADGADPQFYNEAQVDHDLEEFMEVVETRKRAGRV